MGANGCVLSCLAVNGLAIRGLQHVDHLPGIGGAQMWLPRAGARAEPSTRMN
jgi:hypothetical protein